jgi:hypothetical protein
MRWLTGLVKQTLAVLNPFGRIDQHIMDDSDLAGPVLFFFLFGTSLLVSIPGLVYTWMTF